MKKYLIRIGIVLVIATTFFIIKSPDTENAIPPPEETVQHSPPKHSITGIVTSGETLESIFDKFGLDKAELSEIFRSSSDIFNLSRISVGGVYSFDLDSSGSRIRQMRFDIDDESFLEVNRKDDGFAAEKKGLQFSKKFSAFYFIIRSNLMDAMPGTHPEYMKLALKLSDIFAWDIDFSSDIRAGDSVKLIVEELWADGAFKGYGEILAAEIVNDGTVHTAHRFQVGDIVDYFDSNGKSLRKALLRSPLRFKYISSWFSRRRYHPVLRIYRPHLGVDYAAATGTPVSAAGNGTVLYAGYKGQYGKMVNIKHSGGYETYYGHLSKIPRKIRNGAKVSQGDIIGYVGATGLATGPHLDYRIRENGSFVNPLSIRPPRGESVPVPEMARFREVIDHYASLFASLTTPVIASREDNGTSG